MSDHCERRRPSAQSERRSALRLPSLVTNPVAAALSLVCPAPLAAVPAPGHPAARPRRSRWGAKRSDGAASGRQRSATAPAPCTTPIEVGTATAHSLLTWDGAAAAARIRRSAGPLWALESAPVARRPLQPQTTRRTNNSRALSLNERVTQRWGGQMTSTLGGHEFEEGGGVCCS